MRLYLAILMVLALTMVSCSKVEEKPIVVSTDVWIGATPLYYAHAKGWLKEANIEMLQAESINENMQLYTSKASDVVTGTEHEFKRLKKSYPDLVPIIAYDRSVGGDVILSNKSKEEIVASSEKINVFVELDTVSEDMLEYFMKEYGISKERLNIFNRQQSEIEAIRPLGDSIDVAITYNPHDIVLKKNGFMEIASSKNDGYLVIDGFYVSKAFYAKHQDRLDEMKAAFERAKEAYKKDPKEFYETTKGYLGNPSYQEFQEMRSNIEWIENIHLNASMIGKLESIGFPTSDLIGLEEK